MRLADVATPALLADQPRLVRNLTAMATLLARAGVAHRPHIKTSKCLDVVRRQLALGATGVTCATPAEVRLLLDAGVQDVLWAHAPVGPAKVAFAVSAAAGGRLTVALDSAAVAAPLAEAADAAGVTIPYLLEVDTGLGRMGVAPDDAAAAVAELAPYPSLRLRGVMTQEGHVGAALGDRDAQAAAGRRAGEALVGAAEALRAAGHECPVVSVGSTPGAASTPFVPGVTEARPGTYVYYDSNQIAVGAATLADCALTVLTRVVSTRRGDRVIVDAGLKAMSNDPAATGGGLGTVCDAELNPVEDVVFEYAHEEHGFLTGPGIANLAVGDLLRIVPNHACGTVNMFGGVHLVEDDRVLNRWTIGARH
ncbi:alanine racemase [Jiangella anatolica]|uniref:Alanine racemase n=1 Tax=Jiangella anatolica TaxID=2670374 RepID=A0A2W2BZJ5_9ACTN|nr:alanine racemase [Jiangella anatolica]PZF85864.1 alanine racemase [Jiangella anatolica]